MVEGYTDEPEYEYGRPLIEFYGPMVRIGIEGKWVEIIWFDGNRPSRKRLLALIEEMDRGRTQ